MTAPKRPQPDARVAGPGRQRLTTVFRLLRGVPSPARAGISVALGVFIGCLPVYGFHLPLCLLICVPLRLDAVLAYVGANISNPFFAPALLSLEWQVGSFVLTGAWVPLELAALGDKGVLVIAREVVVGSVVVGTLCGAAAGLIAFSIASVWRRQVVTTPLDVAIERTVARYAQAPIGDRIYVAMKLRFDPVLAEVAALGALGEVIDAGCGRGQLGLALHELGAITKLSGFDFDPRKAQLASAAAGEAARFEHGDLLTQPFASADTILLVDVLHYLPRAEQDEVLARARRALRANGRVVVREVDRKRSARSFVARALEWLLTRLGYNRASARLEFRSAESIAERMRELGFACDVANAGRGTPFDNQLIVGVLATPA